MTQAKTEALTGAASWRVEMRGDERCIVDDDGVVAVVFGDDGGAQARAIVAAVQATQNG